MMSNANNSDILTVSLNNLHNYFDINTIIFKSIYTKFLDLRQQNCSLYEMYVKLRRHNTRDKYFADLLCLKIDRLETH